MNSACTSRAMPLASVSALPVQTAASTSRPNSRPSIDASCATPLASPSRSRRASSESCRLAGMTTDDDAAVIAACRDSTTARVNSSMYSGTPSVFSMTLRRTSGSKSCSRNASLTSSVASAPRSLDSATLVT